MKLAAAIGIALILALGGYLLWHGEAKAPTTGSTDAYNWDFADAGQDTQGNPETKVTLNGRTAGTFPGTCQEIDGTDVSLLPGEQAGVECWSANGGIEVGVFSGVVKQGTITQGSAEIPSTRGDFTTLFSL